MKFQSRKFSELSVGLTESTTHVVTLDEIRRFSELVGDFHPLHVDEEYAVNAGFEGVIAQGFLVSSLASSLVSMTLPGESTLIVSQAFRYNKPIYPGNELTIVGAISSLDSRFMVATIEISILCGDVMKASGRIDIKLRF